MTLCYYVAEHGYGYAIRTVQMSEISHVDVRVCIKMTVPAPIFHNELPERDLALLHSAEYDCGRVQSDSVTVLEPQTLARADGRRAG